MERQTKIAFSLIRGLNMTSGNALLERIGSEEMFFTLPSEELKCLSRLKDTFFEENKRTELLEKAKREDQFVYSNDIKTYYFRDNEFPKRLLDPPDSPLMLYQLGSASLDNKYTVGIVGTRHATPVGCKITAEIVTELAEAFGKDITIVSGLAYGIDVAAHKAALNVNVPTIAVMAHPLNKIYPPAHRSIAVKMLKEGGALITEYPTCSKFYSTNFLARNRIIAGLSDVVIVVESDHKGGAMTTARLASDYNRDVFAVPGRLTDKYSNGTNRLISTQKAIIYTGIDSILNATGWEGTNVKSKEQKLVLNLTETQHLVLDFIVKNPDLSVNDMVRELHIPFARLSDILFELEMSDYIISLPGGRYAPLSTE